VSGPRSPLASDYRRLRSEVGAFSLRRDVVVVSGPDALTYLQGQCSQDLDPLGDGDHADALLLSPKGKIDALVRITRVARDRFVLDVDGGFGEAVVARLMRFRLRVKVDVDVSPWRCLAVRGPLVETTRRGWDEPAGTELVVPWSWGDLVGVDLLGPDPQVPRGVVECDPLAWASIRVEAGIVAMGTEIDERTIAAEAGLVERTVSFTKGCFTGQELVARLDARGSKVARRLVGFVATSADAAVPVPGSTVVVNAAGGDHEGAGVDADDVPGEDVVGNVTSSAWSYGLGVPVALGYLHRKVATPGAVWIRASHGDPHGDATAVAAQARSLPLLDQG
jgi:tRNA-modifying protein YgfZ